MSNVSKFALFAVIMIGLLLQGCNSKTEDTPIEVPTEELSEALPAPPVEPEVADNIVKIAPGPDAQEEIQEALIYAEPGDIIELEAGTYNLTLTLSLDKDNVTIRGAGKEETILDFKNQIAGGEGLHIKGDGVVLEDFAVIDTSGNGIKSNGANQIVYRNLSTGWSGGPKASNGAYGIYPVSSQDVLVEGCYAFAASDSGIYVGQSKDVIVRNCIVEYNVAGIEIENCFRADVYNCIATKNTGGLLAFDLPDLPQQRGHDIRFFNNKSYDNTTPNFAPEGNMVAGVPMGTGIMIMANTNVEIFDNDFYDNGTSHVLVVSYYANGLQINDPNYYPYAELINIHDNRFGKTGYLPDGPAKEILTLVVGVPLPDVIWDGVYNEEKMNNGVLDNDARIIVQNNTKTDGGEVTMVSLAGVLNASDPESVEIIRDPAFFTGTAPAIAPVVLTGIE